MRSRDRLTHRLAWLRRVWRGRERIPARVWAVALGCLTLLTLAIGPWSSAAFAQVERAWSSTDWFGAVYVDAKLGFSVRYPSGWNADAEPGIHAEAPSSTVILRNTAKPGDQVEVAVTRGAQMPAAFAAHGAPTMRIGPYPAVVTYLADPTALVPSHGSANGVGSCQVETILAGDDYVVAQACGASQSMGQSSGSGLLEVVLASYTPGSTESRIRALTSASQASARPKTCAQLVASATSRPTDTSNWGRELASAEDPRWSPFPLPAAAVCSNFYHQDGHLISFDGYLFQCNELANRFLREQWGHGSMDGNAATWFDYADGAGGRHPGTARVYPDMQLSDDASQGISAFQPGPGDILVWQDVRDGATWTSGLRASTGHVAVITGTDASHVYFMQQNYNEWHYYMSLPMARVANGWQITDHVSDVPGRIVRGWIHVTANGGPAAPPSSAPLANAQDVYAVGAHGTIYNFHSEHDNGFWASTQRAQAPTLDGQSAVAVIGSPSVTACRLGSESALSVFATGRNGNLYAYTPQVHGGAQPPVISDTLPSPDGVRLVSSPSAVCYARPGDAHLSLAVYALGGNGDLYRFGQPNGGTWSSPADLSAGAKGTLGLAMIPAMSGAPSAVAWVQGTGWHEAAYVTGSDGHLYEFRSDSGGAWHRTDLTALVQFPLTADVTLVGPPDAEVFTPPGASAPWRRVFVIDSDGHLYDYTWTPLSVGDGGQWSVKDVSPDAIDDTTGAAAGSVSLIGSPSADYLSESGRGAQVVFASGSDGHVYEYTHDDSASSAWRRIDVSAHAGQPATIAVAGSPVGYSYTRADDPRVRHSVFAMTADGHLIELSYLQAAAPEWTFAEHGAPAGSALGADPAAIAWVL